MCTAEDERTAEISVSSIASWDQFYKVYKDYRQCDDGSIGEGFSESASLLMADKWRTLSRLEQLALRDTEFLAFVLKHLDQTVPRERLQKIKINAQNRCTRVSREICSATLRAVEKTNVTK